MPSARAATPPDQGCRSRARDGAHRPHPRHARVDGRPRAARLHPRDRCRGRRRRPDRGAGHPVPARAQRLPPHRPRQVDLPQLRGRGRVRRTLQPAVRRHESGQGRAGVHRRHRARRPLARLRLGRPGPVRLRLLRAALRLGRAPDPCWRCVRRRPVGRGDPGDARHADRGGDRFAESGPEPGGEPRPVRPDAGRRVPERGAGAAGEDRYGEPERQPARPGAVSDRPREPPAHRRCMEHLPDVRLRARAVRRDRGRDPLAVHPRVRDPPAAVRLADRSPSGPVAAAPDRVRAPQPRIHRPVQAVPPPTRHRGSCARLGRPSDADHLRASGGAASRPRASAISQRPSA